MRRLHGRAAFNWPRLRRRRVLSGATTAAQRKRRCEHHKYDKTGETLPRKTLPGETTRAHPA
jgi:hypothetical protein